MLNQNLALKVTQLTQPALDTFAESVAAEVFKRAGTQCGYQVRLDDVGRRALFTFRVLAAYSHQEVGYADFERQVTWQRIFDALVQKTLEETTPWAAARKLALKAEINRVWGSAPPDIAPAIDQSGRRHFRMFCEPGRYNLKEKQGGD